MSDAPDRIPQGVELLHRIREIWLGARQQVARSVNSSHVTANWLIGQQIVEAEQDGAARAAYGAQLLETLSANLRAEFGSGFSLSALKYMRSFYLEYPSLLQIRHAVRDQLAGGSIDGEATIRYAPRDLSGVSEGELVPGRLHPGLSWTHYRTLLKVGRRDARDF